MDFEWLRRFADTEPERIARQVRDRIADTDPERIARQVRDQVREYIDMNRKRFEPPPPDPTPAVIAFGGGLALGMVAMYLLDPQEGPVRRRRVLEMFRRIVPTSTPEDTAYSADEPVWGSAETVYGPADATSDVAGSAPGGLGITTEETPSPSPTKRSSASSSSETTDTV